MEVLEGKCRACLGSYDGMRLISDKPQDKHLIDMYTALVHFQWLESDQVAPYLCRECEFTLEMCYNFQRKCTESNSIIEENLQKHDTTENADIIEESEADEKSLAIADSPDKFPQEMIDGLIAARNSAKSTTYHCILCNYFVMSTRALSAHISTNHRDIRNSWCHSCNKLYEDVQEHQKITGCQYEACPLCPRSIRKSCMLLHLRSHAEVKSVPSRKCHRNVNDLSKHMKVHKSTEMKIFMCNLCEKTFKTNSKLQLHIRMHSGDSPYKCHMCHKVCPSPSDLKMHLVTHTGQKPWICNVCGKAYTQHGTLSNHLKQHTGLPEVCNICDKRFPRKSDLRLHLRNHTGEKSYLCNKCGRTFLQHCHLRDHLLSHSDARPHKCHQCDKAFKSKATLASHLKIHDGNKQFKCTKCDYACFKPCRLREHMKQHDFLDKDNNNQDNIMTSSYGCEICEKTFSTKAVLQAHVTLTHDITMETLT